MGESAAADAKMAVHRLAAKTLIKHLETKIDEAEGNDDDRSPYGRRQWSDSEDEDSADGKRKEKELSAEAKAKKKLRKNRKREIVVISTSANVGSRFTAFVGVDPATKDKNLKGKVVIARPPSPQMEMCYMCAPMMSCGSA